MKKILARLLTSCVWWWFFSVYEENINRCNWYVYKENGNFFVPEVKGMNPFKLDVSVCNYFRWYRGTNVNSFRVTLPSLRTVTNELAHHQQTTKSSLLLFPLFLTNIDFHTHTHTHTQHTEFVVSSISRERHPGDFYISSLVCNLLFVLQFLAHISFSLCISPERILPVRAIDTFEEMLQSKSIILYAVDRLYQAVQCSNKNRNDYRQRLNERRKGWASLRSMSSPFSLCAMMTAGRKEMVECDFIRSSSLLLRFHRHLAIFRRIVS